MTEKLFTGTLNHNQNKTNNKTIIIERRDVKGLSTKLNTSQDRELNDIYDQRKLSDKDIQCI